MDGKPVLDIAQIAARTGRSVRVLQQMARSGVIPAHKVGRHWYVLVSDLPKIDKRPHKPTAGNRR